MKLSRYNIATISISPQTYLYDKLQLLKNTASATEIYTLDSIKKLSILKR